jgi:transposase-like protein
MTKARDPGLRARQRAWWTENLLPLKSLGPYEAALRLGANINTVKDWWRKLGMGDRKVQRINWVSRLPTLERYLREGLSSREISRRMGIEKTWLTRMMRRYRITRDRYWSKEQLMAALEIGTLEGAAQALKCHPSVVFALCKTYGVVGDGARLVRGPREPVGCAP